MRTSFYLFSFQLPYASFHHHLPLLLPLSPFSFPSPFPSPALLPMLPPLLPPLPLLPISLPCSLLLLLLFLPFCFPCSLPFLLSSSGNEWIGLNHRRKYLRIKKIHEKEYEASKMLYNDDIERLQRAIEIAAMIGDEVIQNKVIFRVFFLYFRY